MYTFGCIYLGDGQTKKVNKPRVFVVLDLFWNFLNACFHFLLLRMCEEPLSIISHLTNECPFFHFYDWSIIIVKLYNYKL